MRIKLDENRPTRLVSVLSELGHDVDTVPSERIAGKDDAVVWQAAQRDTAQGATPTPSVGLSVALFSPPAERR